MLAHKPMFCVTYISSVSSIYRVTLHIDSNSKSIDGFIKLKVFVTDFLQFLSQCSEGKLNVSHSK